MIALYESGAYGPAQLYQGLAPVFVWITERSAEATPPGLAISAVFHDRSISASFFDRSITGKFYDRSITAGLGVKP